MNDKMNNRTKERENCVADRKKMNNEMRLLIIINNDTIWNLLRKKGLLIKIWTS